MTTPSKFSPGSPVRPSARPANTPGSGTAITDRNLTYDPNSNVRIPTLGGRPTATNKPVSFSGDAFATIKTILANYGLESLAGFVRDSLISGKSEQEILFELRDTPEFKAEFPEIEERRKAGKAAISPGEIIAYRQQAAQLYRAAGLPTSFYDTKEDFRRALVGDVSIAELSDRIQLAREETYNFPPETRRRLAEQFGVTPGSGDLTAFVLDPDKAMPMLVKQVEAARIGGAADRTGYGLSGQQAFGLAQQGVSEQQAAEGFSDLASSQALFDPLEAGDEKITTEQQLGAVFGGNAPARERIDRQRRRRQARFEGGGSYVTGQDGVMGLQDSR